jgi:hypothetical protein
MNARTQQLLQDVAWQFEDAQQPFNDHWQENRNVSSGELASTAMSVAIAIRVFLCLSEAERSRLVARMMVSRYGTEKAQTYEDPNT